jgi:ketosteroid isomerase-like protein
MRTNMPGDADQRLIQDFLAAWNSQNVDRVVACYTEDCIYRDPSTRGPVVGHEAMRHYLTKLFKNWKMDWALREYVPFSDASGGALLWSAMIAPVSGGPAKDIEGMDLVILREGKLARNEVYFDRAALLS